MKTDFPAGREKILPDQFLFLSKAEGERGEKALMWAVLKDALDCFSKQFVKENKDALYLAKEAKEWIFENDYSWPFSFVNICGALRLDPGYIRLGLRRWVRKNESLQYGRGG